MWLGYPLWKGSHPIKTKEYIGHEYVGRIYQLGENVKTDYAGEVVKEGDRVAALFSVVCMKCGPCSRGEFSCVKTETSIKLSNQKILPIFLPLCNTVIFSLVYSFIKFPIRFPMQWPREQIVL